MYRGFLRTNPLSIMMLYINTFAMYRGFPKGLCPLVCIVGYVPPYIAKFLKALLLRYYGLNKHCHIDNNE